ncbi:TlpA family protein disulfide reductase [Saccharothrix longispora]|uniref:Thiol-disulfide isomerase/thioredoxin n=1 Tax=Saccharothrix longispora TaxID=33920 RepID=A0ABU1Q5H0_9PSEU|nr:TlpA disulfide reductase family protein [Saccharothrix longispora]MDR6597654.1 thiol-disulfide isomerase/thioredoxin [Saccharothrix longispora]
MSARARWAAVVLVLAVAGVVALWPRSSEPVGSGPVSTRQAPDVGLARERAALQPCASPPRDQDQQAAGDVGPAALRGLEVTCLGDGARVDAASALPGRAVVNFWATWCVPCQEELRVLDAYAREPGSVPVLTVLVDSKEGDGLELLAKLGVHLPSVHDPDDRLRKALSPPPRTPVTYVVGADGALSLVSDPLVLTTVEQVREVVG